MKGIAVESVELWVLNMRTRMPFRYGIATLTAVPHLLLRLRARIDGQPYQGQAAEGLPPKWFTKDPQAPFRQEVEDMLRVIRHGAALAVEAGTQPTAFDLWWAIYRAQTAWGVAQRYPPLLSGLGASLVERALIDAASRAAGVPFATAVRDGTLGFRPHLLHPDLAPDPRRRRSPAPPRRIAVRHTVGLSDPLRDEDIPIEERVVDGLPQSLAACVRAYGLTHYKIKLSGDAAGDLGRLQGFAAVLRQARPARLRLHPGRQRAVPRRRSVPDLLGDGRRPAGAGRPAAPAAVRRAALAPGCGPLRRHRRRPPVLEGAPADHHRRVGRHAWRASPWPWSGATPGRASSAARGSSGASPTPPCCTAGAGSIPHRPAILSGEDLANVGPVALLQDFAVAATLGLTHVERNGHHYFPGLAMLPEEVQRETLRHHGDLYTTAPGGYPTLDVRQGAVSLGSVGGGPLRVSPSRAPGWLYATG